MAIQITTPPTVWVKNNVLYLSDPDAVTPPAPAPPLSRPQFRGCNLAGGGTYWAEWSRTVGPVEGKHYLFVSTSTIEQLMATGMTTFRLLMTWEAMQPTEYGDILSTTGNFAAYRKKVDDIVAYVTNHGGTVMLDIHGDDDRGFAAYFGNKVGSVTPSGQKVDNLLENFWWQVAGHYKTNPRVVYGVTNEPHDISTSVWYVAAQKVIDGIRSSGATTKIVMPGVDWTGAGTWNDHNASAWNLIDPLNNLAAQVHLYFDQDAGGGVNDIAYDMVGVDRLKNVCDWGRKHKTEIWIAEVGLSAQNPIAAKTWANTMAFIDANRDVFGGLLWWAEGPPAWWSGYRFELIDRNGKTPNLTMIQPAFK